MPAVPHSQPDDQDATVTHLHPGREAANIMLGEFLRQCREERRLNQADLAYVIRGSVSKISRLERGESPAKRRDVMDLADFMSLNAEERRTIEQLLEQALDRAWYQQFSDVTPSYLKRLIALEGSASHIMTYENTVVPGVLHTPDYARALVEKVMVDVRDIERTVELRLLRQKNLRWGNSVRLTALIDEGVLKRPWGGPQAMCEQLEHLLRVTEESRWNIRIVPFGAAGEFIPPYPMTQLEFPSEGPADLVYVEGITGAEYITKPELVDRYRRDLHQVHVAALDRTGSAEKIREAIKSYG
ncbi:helix-turn-helix domain-containing protein [Streptomyces sp. NPDC002526]